MKKQRKSSKPASARPNRKTTPSPSDGGDSRRDFLRLARNLTIGFGIVGGGGYVFAQNVIGTMHEHDLSRVGNGTPTIVQVHDPNCSMCLALQRETRKALKQFQDGRLDYVVANIRSANGQAFANQHGVGHVTLLLFDQNGSLRQVLHGQRGSHQLRAEFAKLLSG